MLSEAVAAAISNIIEKEVDSDLLKSLEDGVVRLQPLNSFVVPLYVFWKVIPSRKTWKMAQKS